MMIQSQFTLVLSLMMLQGCLGALDTLYYHEWKYRLCAHPEHSRVELMLHGVRDLIYAVLFMCLPRWSWGGGWAVCLVILLVTEIVITLIDFVIERRVRQPWGGLASGELMMHALMAIIYGAFLLSLTPHIMTWWGLPTGFASHQAPPQPWMIWAASLMGLGVGLAGVRDLSVSLGVRILRWPWGRDQPLTKVI